MTTLPVKIRRFDEDIDCAFVVDTWVRSARRHARHVPSAIWFPAQRALVGALLTSVDTRVACVEDDESQIVGCLCSSFWEGATALHWLYVKHIYRGFGIGRMLLDELPDTTYVTYRAPWITKHLGALIFTELPLHKAVYDAAIKSGNPSSRPTHQAQRPGGWRDHLGSAQEP